MSKRLSFEREDILEHLAAIGLANAQDYYEPYTYIETHTNPVTGETRESTRQGWALKPIHKLSRLQAYAIDNLIYDVASGRMSYTLPSARLRAKTLTTLGENTKALNPKDPSTGVKRHLHVHATVEELAALEREFARIFGPQEARAVLGLTPDDQQDG